MTLAPAVSTFPPTIAQVGYLRNAEVRWVRRVDQVGCRELVSGVLHDRCTQPDSGGSDEPARDGPRSSGMVPREVMRSAIQC